MENRALFNSLRGDGSIEEEGVYFSKDMAKLMTILDAMSKSGVSVVVKMDGERKESPYTVIISGAMLGDSFFRKDGCDLLSLFQEAIDFYVETILSQ